MKTTRPMPSMQGVSASQIATLTMPIGLTYHALLLKYSGVTLAQMTEIRIKANGRQIFSQSAADLDLTNQYLGLAASSGLLYIPFDRSNLLTRQGQEISAIGTGAPFNNDPNSPAFNPTPLSTLQLEIDLAAGTSPVLSSKAIQSAPRPLGAIIKRRRFNYNQGGAGTFEISDLPKGDLIDKIYIKTSADNLTRVQLERDNFLTFEREPAENNLLQSDGVRVPQTNLFVIDPTERGFGAESIVSAISDFRLKFDASDATNYTIYVDYFGSLGGN